MPSRAGTITRLAIALLAGVILSAFGASTAQAAPTMPPGFQDEPVATGIDRPTSLAFTPDGRLLIAGEAGTVHVYETGSLRSPAALDISAKVCSDVERGLMAVAVDPEFTTNRFVYLYYTWNKHGVCEYAPSPQAPVNRVSRFVLGDDDRIDAASEVVLIDNIPAPQGYHIGADLQFGKDRYLYVSTGDGGCDYADPVWCDEYNDASRDQHVLLGKVLRITRDGGIPSTNPYRGADSARCNVSGRTTAPNKCQETYAWGLRNPFRLAFDPNAAATRFFINDVGEITWEEIDLGQAGADYGWNVREGHCATGSTSDCGAPPAGMTNPIHDYNHDTGCTSITGGAFVPNGVWPSQHDNAYLYADLACGRVFELTAQPGGGYASSVFASGFGDWSLVALTFGPNGSRLALYYTTFNGPGHQIRRITYTGPERGYPRPIGAAKTRVTLVPAHKACLAPSSAHGAPLDRPSCAPAQPNSDWATVPNDDTTRANGSALMRAVLGDPSTPADEADVSLTFRLADVRNRNGLSDYAGELQAATVLRITDRHNGPSQVQPATVADFDFRFAIPCATNSDGLVGSTCSVTTSADSLMPGSAREGARSAWELGKVRVYDGGADGLAATSADNTLFATQGIFVP